MVDRLDNDPDEDLDTGPYYHAEGVECTHDYVEDDGVCEDCGEVVDDYDPTPWCTVCGDGSGICCTNPQATND